MRSIDLGKRRGSRRRRVCSDSTNYAPAANAKCMRNKPRARMPPNGRNCISPLLPPLLPLSICRVCELPAAAWCMRAPSTQRYSRVQTTKYSVPAANAHELTSHEKVSFLSLPLIASCIVGLLLTRRSVFVSLSIVFPHPPLLPLPSHSGFLLSFSLTVYYSSHSSWR